MVCYFFLTLLVPGAVFSIGHSPPPHSPGSLKSLGGNCKTTMMAMISPALESMVETLSTVKFASRAKNIKNQPIVNEDFDQKVGKVEKGCRWTATRTLLLG